MSIWLEVFIEGVLSKYEVSIDGLVWDRENNSMITINDNGAGYKVVSLHRGRGKTNKMCYIHRLVAMHFLPNPHGYPQVGHKDHNKENNSLENLEWITQSKNTRDGIKAGRINSQKRPNMKKLSKENLYEIAKLESEGVGKSEIARRIGFARTTVSSVFNGRSNKKLFESYRDIFNTK